MFTSRSGKNYLVPFILIASLYLLWGCAHGLLDVLNKQFQGTFDMSKAESGFIQFSTYIGYFIMAIPAGLLLNKVGYKRGIISGLTLFALGAFAFIPAAFFHTPIYFLIALFIIACGLCIIETAAHPYATSMGNESSSAQRINLAAAFNGIGWILGPLIGGALIFGAEQGDNMAIAKPYIFVGLAVLLVGIALFFIKLPEINPTEGEEHVQKPTTSIWSHKNLIFAIIAQFMYVGAQTGIFSFFINYVTELDNSLSNLQASRLLSFGGMGLFLIGRLSGVGLMKIMKPSSLLALFGGLSIVCMLLVIASLETISVYALYLSFFLMSIMFPTIFALGVRGLGVHTKKASSYIIMSLIGGAIFPVLMGLMGEHNMAIGFILPLIAFIYITGFAWSQRRF